MKDYTYLGIVNRVTEDGYAVIEQRNKFAVGDQLEVMRKNGDNVSVTVISLKDEEGNEMESCPHPQQKIYVKLSEVPEEFDLLRQKAEEK